MAQDALVRLWPWLSRTRQGPVALGLTARSTEIALADTACATHCRLTISIMERASRPDGIAFHTPEVADLGGSRRDDLSSGYRSYVHGRRSEHRSTRNLPYSAISGTYTPPPTA